jgi:hypothetical protein
LELSVIIDATQKGNVLIAVMGEGVVGLPANSGKEDTQQASFKIFHVSRCFSVTMEYAYSIFSH